MDKQVNNLKFKVTNLGVIKEGEFTQKPLTIFCGPNNSGKTWVMYSLFYYHHCLQSFAEGVADKKVDLENLNRQVAETLVDLFNTRRELLADARFDLLMENQHQYKELLAGNTLPGNIFLMPAERNGLHLFYRELSMRRNALLHHASRENIDLHELLRDVIRSRYAIPIARYIDWLNQLPDIQRKSGSTDFHEYAEYLKKQIAGGAYNVDKRSGSIEFKPYQRKRDGNSTQLMGLHMTSSTVKSLFGLWFYLENQAQAGDLLMIGEPELNIHPLNQRKIARLLAKLVRAGLKVVISTHSDYIVREFNSLIMLNRDSADELRKKHGYHNDETLVPEQVGAYLFDNQTIRPFEITSDDGIYATTFDDVINELNQVNDDIYYQLREKLQDDSHD